MSTHHTLSLPLAILININIMLGAGIFINTALVARYAGFFGFAGYLLMGVLLLPLIVCIMRLLELHPSGGFYIFAQKEISPFAGFISAWGYFIGKLASAVLMIHTSLSLIQYTIPALSTYNTIILDAFTLTLFIALNMLHLRTGGIIQTLFIVFKSIPVLFVILSGVYLITQATPAPITPPLLADIPTILPLFLYAAMGFEAACSFSSRIANARKNAPRVIFISYAIVVTILSLYQFFMYFHSGTLLAAAPDFRSAFPLFLQTLFSNTPSYALSLVPFFHLAIAASALGGAYGILFSNNWNLYTLAQHGHTFMPTLLTRFNRFDIPWVCVLIEGAICGLYLLIAQGSQLPMQQLSSMGSIIAYSMSVFALIAAKRAQRITHVSWITLLSGVGSCTLLLSSCLYGLIQKGPASLITFLILLAGGIFMFFKTKTTLTEA